jgi:hypothetical protein
VANGLRDSTFSLRNFDVPLDLILVIYKSQSQLASSIDIVTAILPDVFVFSHLFPMFCGSHDDTSFQRGRHLWKVWLGQSRTEQQAKVFTIIKEKLRDMCRDTQVQPT